MTVLRLLLGDQLNPMHSWFHRVDPDAVHVLMEVRQETDYVLHHAQKIIAIFAAMRDFAGLLERTGFRVEYLRIDDPANTQSIVGNLDLLIARHKATRFEYQAPDEWRLDRQLAEWAGTHDIPVQMCDSEHFYTGRRDAAAFFSGRKRWMMEPFYRHMRVRHDVLMDGNGKPAGGRWNFDAQNRKPWRGKPAEPKDLRPLHDHSTLWRTIDESGAVSFGDPSADHFRWPLNRTEALQHLDDFVANALAHFGDYQDAMDSRSTRLFHSLLSFALNTKMIGPQEVVARVERAWRMDSVPLGSAEGFIRQILGWREYVRGVYWARMPGYTASNALRHSRKLPEWFWTGKTRMRCLHHAIEQSLKHAHAHHIQRLMIIGNFALLAGLDPEQVHRWYLGIYIDAFEWVEAPNTLGMSQFADGGFLGTKPYAASAAYIHRMSDYCNLCPYNHRERVGKNACPFNALYWNFLITHRDTLESNPRMAMPYRQLLHMPADVTASIRSRAMAVIGDMDEL